MPERRITVLVLSSSPTQASETRAGDEARAIAAALQPRGPWGEYDVQIRPQIVASEFDGLVRDFRPQILHFSGHGGANGELYFVGPDDTTRSADINALAQTFAAYPVTCVVLSACYTFALARAIAAHVDVVIGMAHELRTPDAIAFSESFYGALAANESIGHAFEAGKRRLGLEERDTDVLRMRAKTGVDPDAIFVKPAGLSGPADVIASLLDEIQRRTLDGEDVSDLKSAVLEVRREVRSGPDLRPGQTLDGRYLLRAELGVGGFASVWQALDRKSDRSENVAVKVLHNQWARDETRLARFAGGAKRLADLRHPAIVRLLEAPKSAEGRVYCVMPLFARDLRHAVVEEALDRAAALGAVVDALDALAYAHDEGVIHRDVKPGNILLDTHNRGHVTDFDLAHAKDSTQGTRTVGMGTFGYAAPEQQRDAKRVGPQADVYGAAMCVLFVLIRADPPVFVSKMEPQVFDQLECGDGLREALRRAASYEVEQRTISCQDLANVIRSELEGTQSERRPVARTLAPHAGVELVLLPGGTFMMGSPTDEDGRQAIEGPRHELSLASFYLAKTPVTNAQYARYLAANRSADKPESWGMVGFNQPRQPVVGVSWYDARAFCEWAGLVLPTEAQWEYACRAGTTTRFWSGDAEADLARSAWYEGNSGGRIHAVAELAPNPFGLYDMHGNIWEWCLDAWADDYATARAREGDGLRRAPDGDGNRVNRGGSAGHSAQLARSAHRNYGLPGNRWLYLGFRPAKLHTGP